MNARTKKVAMVLGVASIVLVWRVYVIIADYMPQSAEAGQLEAETTELAPQPDMPDPLAAVWEKQRRSLEERPWGRNPFEVASELKTAAVETDEEAPIQDKPLAAPSIGFSGASRVGDTYRAILKSGIVAVGDSVEGPFTVKSIDRTKLTIASGNWHYIYELGSERPTVRRSGENND